MYTGFRFPVTANEMLVRGVGDRRGVAECRELTPGTNDIPYIQTRPPALVVHTLRRVGFGLIMYDCAAEDGHARL